MKPTAPITATGENLKGVVRTRLDSPNPTAVQEARRKRHNEKIRSMDLPVLEDLPVVEDEASVKPRSKDDVVRRCLSTAICAVKGETGDQKLTRDLVKRFKVADAFSPEEKAFAEAEKWPETDRPKFAWRYECSHVFLWALGYVDELKPPNEICDVAADMAILHEKGPERFASDAKLRPLGEILDQADYYYRLHWAAIDLRLKEKSSPEIDEEIIMERHRALNWLIRYMNQEWDDVETDT